MHTIKITYDGKTDYNDWVKESNKILGLPEDAYIGGRGSFEFVWFNNSLYRRIQKEFDFFYLLEDFAADNDPPHVLCECGSTQFELRYNGYKMIASCAKCGKESVVYDG